MNILWTERYRPTTLDGVALLAETRSLIEGFLAAGEIPHLLLHGPSGTGKTTLAKILVGALDCQVLSLNASKERGIDVIRGQVSTFSRAVFGKRWNIVFLDEADKLTPDAQTALRNDMETFAGKTRFILTGNFLHKVIDPLQSRCMVVELSQMPLKERFGVLVRILESEGIDFTPYAILGLVERHTDMRRLLSQAQRVALSEGSIHNVPEDTLAGSGVQVMDAIRRKDWPVLVQLSKSPGFDHRGVLQDMFWTITEEDQSAIDNRLVIARAVDRSGYTPDAVIHFLGTCAELYDKVG